MSFDFDTVSAEVLESILESFHCRITLAPVAQYRIQPKKLSTQRRVEEESRIDYDFEADQAEKMWNDPAPHMCKGGEVDGLFGFVHQSSAEGFRVELHRVTGVLAPKFGRDHWLARHSERKVLRLSDTIGGISFERLKSYLVTATGEDYNLKRLAGTRTAKFNPKLENAIHEELAKRKNISETEASIWSVEDHPIDDSVRDIVIQASRTILGSRQVFFENQIIGTCIAAQMLLNPNSHGRGICGADLQSGKTGIQALIAASFRKIAVHLGKMGPNEKLGVIQILNISDRAIQAQSQHAFHSVFMKDFSSDNARIGLRQGYMDSDTLFCNDMLSTRAVDRIQVVKDELDSQGCTKFLIISDETQVAITPDQQLGKALAAMFGMTARNESKNTWVLGVTATAARFYMPTSDGHPITLCWVDSGDVYYGLEDLINDERIIEQPEKYENVEHLSDVFEDGMRGADDKYALVRYNPAARLQDGTPQLKAWQAVAHRHGYIIKEFDSKNANIDEVPEILSAPPSKAVRNPKVVILIKGALKAGVTLSSVEHIACAFDSFSGDDSVVQSLAGRMCGNQPDRRMGPKVYTRKSKIEQYVHDKSLIAGGVVPKPRSRNLVGDKMISYAGGAPEIKCIQPGSTDVIELTAQLIEMNAAAVKASGKMATFYLDENIKDLAAEILQGVWSHGQRIVSLTRGKPKETVMAKNGMSIEKLIKSYPELETGWVLIATNPIQNIAKRAQSDTAFGSIRTKRK